MVCVVCCVLSCVLCVRACGRASVSACVRACLCGCEVRACVRACVRVRVRARVRATRVRDTYMHADMHMYIMNPCMDTHRPACMCVFYIYIYVCIERASKRERERERKKKKREGGRGRVVLGGDEAQVPVNAGCLSKPAPQTSNTTPSLLGASCFSLGRCATHVMECSFFQTSLRACADFYLFLTSCR